MTDLLHSVREGRILRVTLNRPEKRNALDAALCAALVDALEAAEGDAAIGAILLSGRGKAFCAGMDLAEIEHATDTGGIDALHEGLFTVGSRLTKPIVAAVQGPAIGGGTGLVANCHVVVAGADATFGLTEIRLGLWPFLIYRAVAAAVGERRTLELALTGRTFGAEEALGMVLAHQVVGDPMARALEIARLIADYSPAAVERGMGFVREIRGVDSGRVGEIAKLVRNQIFGSPDFQEGIRAFREKRPPRWPSISKAQP